MKLLNSKRIAEEHRVRADFVATQFEEERNESERLVNNLVRQYQQDANIMVSKFIYSEPVASVEKSVKALKKIIELDPENESPYDKLVYSLFIMHDFEAILPYRDKFVIGHRNDDLFTACEKYKSYKKKKSLLDIESFKDLLSDLSVSGIATGIKRTHLSEKMLAYYLEKKGKIKKPEIGIMGVLKTWNPDWDFTGFSYKKDEKRLSANNKYLKIFTYIPAKASGKCILRYLDINHLDLSGSGIYDLRQIDDLNITSLDLRNTNVNSLVALNSMALLKSITINEDQFSANELSKLKSRIEVNFRKK